MALKFVSKKGDRCDSQYERDVADSLFARGISYEHQPGPYEYSTPVVGGFCADCDSNNVRQGRSYTPDFMLIPSGRLVEAKGKFLAHQRGLLTHFIRSRSTKAVLSFVFMRDNYINRKTSRTRLTGWATKQKCESAVGIHIPKEWAND